jgi:hypothetical protein
MLKRDGVSLRLTIARIAGLPWITQLLLTNLVLIEVKEVPGQNSRYGSTTAQLSFGGHVHECLRSP